MIKNQGQVLAEFVFVLVVLLIATTGVFYLYKRFWKTSYQKASVPSSAIAGVITQANYIK